MIELHTLQKVIDQTPVLDLDALVVQTGEIAAVVGPPGSGKTVLFDLLLGRTRPTVGTVRLAGIDPLVEREPFSQHVGVLFAEDSLYKHRSPLANLVFDCHLRGIPKARAHAVLNEVGLADCANARLDKLSAGLVRRLAFGRAIVHDPNHLVLFDPFARCDEASTTLLTRLIRQKAEGDGTVLILADDDAHLATLCDTLYQLEQGHVVEVRKPAEEEASQLPFKIPARLEGRVALVNPGDILFALAKDGRAYVHTVREELPTQFTLSELEERLARSGFFRAHRGYLVNLQHVREVIPYTRNSFSLILDDADETEIPLSKSAAAELRELLGY